MPRQYQHKGGPLALLSVVYGVPEPAPKPKPPTLYKTYRKTIQEILDDTDFISPTGCMEHRIKGPTGGTRYPNGYSRVLYRGKDWYAHRLIALHVLVQHPGWRSWLEAHSREVFVCHTCDNPPCINPEHLVLASPQWNTLDAIAKGRHTDRGKVIAQVLLELKQELVDEGLPLDNLHEMLAAFNEIV